MQQLCVPVVHALGIRVCAYSPCVPVYVAAPRLLICPCDLPCVHVICKFVGLCVHACILVVEWKFCARSYSKSRMGPGNVFACTRKARHRMTALQTHPPKHPFQRGHVLACMYCFNEAPTLGLLPCPRYTNFMSYLCVRVHLHITLLTRAYVVQVRRGSHHPAHLIRRALSASEARGSR